MIGSWRQMPPRRRGRPAPPPPPPPGHPILTGMTERQQQKFQSAIDSLQALNEQAIGELGWFAQVRVRSVLDASDEEANRSGQVARVD